MCLFAVFALKIKKAYKIQKTLNRKKQLFFLMFSVVI